MLLAATTATAAEISGVVLDVGGQPVAGATVGIEALALDATTDEDGSFVLEVKADGRYEVLISAPGFARLSRNVTVESGSTEELRVRLVPLRVTETVTVSSSYSMLERTSVSGTAMQREDIENLPHFGDDLYRVIGVLPSTTSNDVSSKFGVRGGLGRENLVLLDGLEIFEPFHLKDYEGVFSIFDPRMIGGADLFPGAFSAKYGDRSSGVLSMDTVMPAGRATSVGVSLSNVWVNSTGRFDEGNGAWIASARRGYLDIVMDLAGANDEDEKEDPSYTDVFGRVSWWVTPKQSIALNVLFADDTLDLEEKEAEEDIVAETSYGNWYVWGTHEMVPTPKLFVETVLALGHMDRDRDADGLDHGDTYVIRDIRDTDVLTLKQSWSYELSDRQLLEWGFEARSYDTEYDYRSTVSIGRGIPDPRFRPPQSSTDFQDTFDGEYYSAFLSNRFRPARDLTAEIGARYERLTLTDEDHVSPRINLLWNMSERNSLNAGWGYVYQSHRPNELDVQDGEREFMDAERAEHRVLGFERRFRAGWSLRAEAYERRTEDPRVRYSNLFDPLGQFPEAAYDRIRIAPTRSTSRGIELFVRGAGGEKLDWWASYVWSEVEDRIDGRDQKRWFDQPHAVTLNANYRPGPRWNLNAVWLYHTGWPDTEVTAELVSTPSGPEVVPRVGPFYDERLPDYHRLDVRASYTKAYGKSRLTFFIDVQNLYGRTNLSGYEYDDDSFLVQPDGSVRVVPEEEDWLGLLPSFGVSWEF
jgi:hypothetical protein